MINWHVTFAQKQCRLKHLQKHRGNMLKKRYSPLISTLIVALYCLCETVCWRGRWFVWVVYRYIWIWAFWKWVWWRIKQSVCWWYALNLASGWKFGFYLLMIDFGDDAKSAGTYATARSVATTTRSDNLTETSTTSKSKKHKNVFPVAVLHVHWLWTG
jgi:hypothetical protein